MSLASESSAEGLKGHLLQMKLILMGCGDCNAGFWLSILQVHFELELGREPAVSNDDDVDIGAGR